MRKHGCNANGNMKGGRLPSTTLPVRNSTSRNLAVTTPTVNLVSKMLGLAAALVTLITELIKRR